MWFILKNNEYIICLSYNNMKSTPHLHPTTKKQKALLGEEWTSYKYNKLLGPYIIGVSFRRENLDRKKSNLTNFYTNNNVLWINIYVKELM